IRWRDGREKLAPSLRLDGQPGAIERLLGREVVVDDAGDRARHRLGIVVLEDGPAHRDAGRTGVHRAADGVERGTVAGRITAGGEDGQAGRAGYSLEALGIARVARLDEVSTELLAESGGVSEAFGIGLVDARPACVGHREHGNAELGGAFGDVREVLDL